MPKKVIVVGSGNAAMCAALASLENGAQVLMLEKAEQALAGGNTKYTAGAMRFSYQNNHEILALVHDKTDRRLAQTDFGCYSSHQFSQDLLAFNDGRDLSLEQQTLVAESAQTLIWLSQHNIRFEPIYNRQSYKRNGRYVFWGGLTIAAVNEGVGLFEMQRDEVLRWGGRIEYNNPVKRLAVENNRIVGVVVNNHLISADAVVLACGGFEANAELRSFYLGQNWGKAKVRGTPHNQGDGLTMAVAVGAAQHGFYQGCHATPMDLHMPDYGGLHLPPKQRKNYRKICYFLGVMVNCQGQRFVDEGINFRNYTYAQFGRAIIQQPKQCAWQIFDSKVLDLLYEEYHFEQAHYVQANSLDELISKLPGIDHKATRETLVEYNQAVNQKQPFDPTQLDGKSTIGLKLAKSNWAQTIDTSPFRAYPVTAGITFTYGGLKVNEEAQVLDQNKTPIEGLYACGELVGGVFFNGYPGGSGLTSGAVFGRKAGTAASLAN